MLLPEAEGAEAEEAEAEEAEAEEAEAEEAEAEEAEEVFFFADLPGGGGQLPTGTQGGRPARTEACASSFNETISILGNLAAPGGKRNVQHPSVGGGLASVAKCPTRAAPKRGARTEATRLQDLNHPLRKKKETTREKLRNQGYETALHGALEHNGNRM